MDDIRHYWDAVRSKVCEHCVDGDGSGNCRMTPGQECALQSHFSEIVNAVLAVKSDSMQPYIEALRLDICTTCKHQSPDGTCTLRTHLDCGLDRYFPLVIDAIEAVNAARGSNEPPKNL